MADITNKVKNFWEEHKTVIMIAGITTSVLSVGALALNCYKRGCYRGVDVGALCMLGWLDERLPDDVKLIEWYKEYVKEHPEEMHDFKV